MVTARPEFAARAGLRPDGNLWFVSLEALGKADAWALARHAGRTDPTGIERAEGNPLFIIELARARQVGTAPDVPITLKGIIGARLDELPQRDRELLQRVAVVGETFTVDDAILLSGREPADVLDALPASRDANREAGIEPPSDLYPSALELQIYTSGMFVQPPDGALVEALLQEGEGVARRAGNAASLARLLALRAYQSHDATQLLEALHLSDKVTDPGSLGSFLEHAAILQFRAGEFAAARRSYERLDGAASVGGSIGERLEFRAILALNSGNLGEAQELAEKFRAASASRGPHLQTHAHREQCHVLLAQGNWRGLGELAAETERLVAEHPETAFCYAVTTVPAFASIAHAVERRGPKRARS